MAGSNLLLAGSLLLLAQAPVCALATDVKAQSSTQYRWYAAQLLCDSPDELDDGSMNESVSFSGKAAFSR